MNTKAKIGIGLLAVLLLIVLLTEGVLIPKQLQPDALPLRFKEYREDTKLTAVFEMENQAGSPVVVWETAALITHRESEQDKQQIALQRTVIPEGETGTLVVDAPRDGTWQVEFNVARFGPRQQRRFEAGETVKGTIVYSDIVAEYESKP